MDMTLTEQEKDCIRQMNSYAWYENDHLTTEERFKLFKRLQALKMLDKVCRPTDKARVYLGLSNAPLQTKAHDIKPITIRK